MAGTKLGGTHAAETNKAIYGEDFYKKIGAVGGSRKGFECKGPKGFAGNRELAAIAGAKGGRISRRSKSLG